MNTPKAQENSTVPCRNAELGRDCSGDQPTDFTDAAPNKGARIYLVNLQYTLNAKLLDLNITKAFELCDVQVLLLVRAGESILAPRLRR